MDFFVRGGRSVAFTTIIFYLYSRTRTLLTILVMQDNKTGNERYRVFMACSVDIRRNGPTWLCEVPLRRWWSRSFSFLNVTKRWRPTNLPPGHLQCFCRWWISFRSPIQTKKQKQTQINITIYPTLQENVYEMTFSAIRLNLFFILPSPIFSQLFMSYCNARVSKCFMFEGPYKILKAFAHLKYTNTRTIGTCTKF